MVGKIGSVVGGAWGQKVKVGFMAFLPGAPEVGLVDGSHLPGLGVTRMCRGEVEGQRALGPSPHRMGPFPGQWLSSESSVHYSYLVSPVGNDCEALTYPLPLEVKSHG